MILKIIPHDLIIFGATGDLAKRKLFPALYRLEKKKKLTSNMRIIGISRSQNTIKEYKNIIYSFLKKFLNENIELSIWNKFKKRLFFCKIDVNQIYNFKKLMNFFKKKNNILINYFAVSSNMFVNICKGLASIKLNTKQSKIIIEKPIGNSLRQFYIINKSIKKYFSEKQIFRIDHYLGKESILNLISLKFANPWFNNILNDKNIDHIQITLSEKLGIENRWNYFNETGQIIDMIQNHMLQIISIFSMNTPKSLKKKHIQKEKIKILKSLSHFNNKNIYNSIALGQYSEGKINNHMISSYLQEKGANKNSLTETFVSIKLYINNSKWKNIPFYIRTGKRLTKKCSKIVIYFKELKNNLFYTKKINTISNSLTINLHPEFGIKIKFFNKKPELNSKFKLKPCEMFLNYKKIFKKYTVPEEYDRLLLDSIIGNPFLFVHEKEIIYSWKWIDPIIRACKKNPSLLKYYPSGTWGPKSSNYLIQNDKREWDND
ncbi:Glucose-6-phosphate 1-dehydrogenase [Buchnera aphidicola (Cinara piceae)]|uniref:Glucose-6-phosphate 1-dehydrogenase n=1 Tax=Buchnera aphidicola (Cinara piceae) TaxID=1660043 RepID=A0A803FTW1_9GAMM|nr:glucose-6-phosphate dehydrogenase [Buchnera aphidicola]VFP88353.1 Glucose-6-phosphate 1-dehydrogenase [Buchnera aphidicola (Cinara piceae)]